MRESLNARLSARYCKDVLEPEIKDEFDSAFEDMINLNVAYAVMLNKVNLISKHRLTRAHREKQLKMSCQALHNAPPNRT